MSLWSNKIAFLVAVMIISAMMVDVSLARVYDLIGKDPTSVQRIIIFTAIVAICITGQYFFISFVGRRTTHFGDATKYNFSMIGRTVRFTQYAITIVLIVLLSQVYFVHQYHTLVLKSAIWISYGMGIFTLGLLAERFFSWYRSNRNLVVILYAFAAVALSANLAFTFFYVNDVVSSRPEVQMPYSGGSMPFIPPGSVTAMLNNGMFISSVISFALLWGSTAVLLHHYSLKLGSIRYWLVIVSPLVLFLAQFIGYFSGLFVPLLSSDPVTRALWLSLIFTWSKPIGGILFAIGFFSIARNFRQNVALRNYLIISALGFAFLFVSNQASMLIVTPYPPFGVPSVSFTGFASFMILLGIYSSAISISEDVKLRKLIRTTALDQAKLLDSLGTATLTENIQNKVVKIRKDVSDQMQEIAGLESMPSEEDLKQYVEEVVNEISKSRERNPK
jgi:hypothetical protein